jgi:hypothetical protein
MINEQEDAWQQAVHDVSRGVTSVDPSRFPEKSYNWICTYRDHVTYLLEAVQDSRCVHCGQLIHDNGIDPPVHTPGGYQLCVVNGERPGTTATVHHGDDMV